MVTITWSPSRIKKSINRTSATDSEPLLYLSLVLWSAFGGSDIFASLCFRCRLRFYILNEAKRGHANSLFLMAYVALADSCLHLDQDSTVDYNKLKMIKKCNILLCHASVK